MKIVIELHDKPRQWIIISSGLMWGLKTENLPLIRCGPTSKGTMVTEQL